MTIESIEISIEELSEAKHQKKDKGNLRDILLGFVDVEAYLSDSELIDKILSIEGDVIFESPDKSVECLEYTLQFVENIGFTEGIARVCMLLGEHYRLRNDFKKSLQYFGVSIKHNASDNKLMEARISKGIGNNYLQIGELYKALEYYQNALSIYEAAEDIENCGSIYNNIGIVYKDRGEYEKALSYYLKSLRIKEEKNELRVLANIYLNVGNLYVLQNEHRNALGYFEKILELSIDIAGGKIHGSVQNSMGEVWAELGDYPKAIEHIHCALDVYEGMDDEAGIAVSRSELGRVLQLKGKYHDADINFQRALDIFKALGSLGNVAETLHLIGDLNYQIEEYEKAEQYLLESYELFEELDMKASQIVVSELLSDLYHDTDRFLESCVYMKHHSRLQGELATEEKARLMAEMKARFELQQRDSMIKNLKTKEEMLVKANQELELFAGKAAHDLKEPLRMMSSFSSLLARKYGEQIDNKGQEFIRYINEGAQRMEKLLTDMLTFAKSGAAPGESVEVDLDDTMLMVESNLKFAITEKQADIQYSELPKVKAASIAMVQLFQNIIANALKFTQPDTPPIVQINVVSYDEIFYKISIKDNGIGIPESQQQKVFLIFQRAHGGSDYEGTGIGLATCKKIVECLGGRIWLESIEGEGTTFFFLLPKV